MRGKIATILFILGFLIAVPRASAGVLYSQPDLSGGFTTNATNDAMYQFAGSPMGPVSISGTLREVKAKFRASPSATTESILFIALDASSFVNACGSNPTINLGPVTGGTDVNVDFDMQLAGHTCNFVAGHSYYMGMAMFDSAENTPKTYQNAAHNAGYSYLTTDPIPPPPPSCSAPLTSCITSFTPLDNSTTTSPVTFTLDAYIDPNDLGTFTGVYLYLHNIDQNVLLLSAWSPSDILLVNEQATTSGAFHFATTTTIGDGNYRLQAKLTHSTLGFSNPFSSANQDISHQFIVGQATFIGNISQNSFSELQQFYATSTATSTAALASSCNPLSNFDVRNCLTFLIVPGGDYLNQSVQDLQTGVLNRPPWGYLTRLYSIWNSTATTSLPSFTAHVQIGPGDDMTPDTTTLTFNIGDMVTGGSAILQSITDPINGMTARDVFQPLVQLSVALAVIMTIINDLTGSHKHYVNADTGEDKKKKLS